LKEEQESDGEIQRERKMDASGRFVRKKMGRRFLIFHSSYTWWILISAGKVLFIQSLTDYLFFNISYHFSISKPRGGLGMWTSTSIECKGGYTFT